MKKTPSKTIRPILTLMLCLLLAAALLQWEALPASASVYINLEGPANSGKFGSFVAALPNGNIVIADPYADSGAVKDVGAVYLFNGATRALISVLMGSTANDHVGGGWRGIVVLTNGNFVVSSPDWDNGLALNAGAVTWGSAVTGVSGWVSSSNSLVGGSTNDKLGYDGIVALNNGNYVVTNRYWDNGSAIDAGAVTWGNGATGVSGLVSTANSLVGSHTNDNVRWVVPLSNGNYVVQSPDWDNGSITDAGAVTWADGTTGVKGIISQTNSLVGLWEREMVGDVVALSNGNFVVNTARWDNGGDAQDAGAVTWADGDIGITGVVTLTNSLVGSTAGDNVGYFGVVPLSNGNYVVGSEYWDNGSAENAGAVTWCDGTTGRVGVVSMANSLVGSTTEDRVGKDIYALTNGNYVAASYQWHDSGIGSVGAATWCNGSSGCTGGVSSGNSLVGSMDGDAIGLGGVLALSNGNYVVSSPYWHNGGVAIAGAATWGDGSAGVVGPVSETNSLVGSSTGDSVSGGNGLLALKNGHYVVASTNWDHGGVANVGAVTWGDGTVGAVGPVSAANSLRGSTTNDWVGRYLTALDNGDYLVTSAYWDNGAISDAGAITWGDGTGGTIGVISDANSLVGGSEDDQIGWLSAEALPNGDYIAHNPFWDKFGLEDAGAVTWGLGDGSTIGPITSRNSVIGGFEVGGPGMVYDYDVANNQLVVGRPEENLVTLFRLESIDVHLPMLKH